MIKSDMIALIKILETNFHYFSILKDDEKFNVWIKYLNDIPTEQAKFTLDRMIKQGEKINDFTPDLMAFKRSFKELYPESNSGRINGFNKTNCCNFGIRFILMGGDQWGIRPLSKKTLVANGDEPVIEVKEPVFEDSKKLSWAKDGRHFKGTIYKFYKSGEVPCDCNEGQKYNLKMGLGYSVEQLQSLRHNSFKTIPDLLKFYEDQLLPITDNHIN